MKKITLLVMSLIMGVLPLFAELTILVMDSSQALIPNAQVTLGTQSVKTRADGKAVLKNVNGKLTITCDGYAKKTLPIDKITNDSLMMVTIALNKNTKNTHSVGRPGAIRTCGTVLYRKTATFSSSDMAVEEEVMDEAVPVMSYAATISGKMEVANNAVSAGRLTAGEVNDFSRWTYWQHVLNDTHKQYVSDWQIRASQRYVAQVINSNGYPFANRAVSLLDANGNTLFQAVTDNTGKAELWADLTREGQATGSLQISVEDKLVQAVSVEKGWNTIVLDEACEAPDGVDVFFVFDATGSMGDELRYLQAEMQDVISRAESATGGLSIRTGAVVYRDHGDEYLTRISRLTDHIATTRTFIDKQIASGGGDFPEAVPEALMAALNSGGWNSNARARIAFLILDAPCHTDSTTIALLHEQILNAAAFGVRIVPIVCSGLDQSGELLMRSIALATNGLSFFLTDDSGIGHSHLKPTTDSLKVEHLNDMLVRTIVEFSYMPDCAGHWNEQQIEQVDEAFVPNPFDISQLSDEEKVSKDSRTTLYLLDITGKLILVYNGNLDEAGDSQLSAIGRQLSTGVYFVKAFYDGEWHTRKILVH
ncbi:MAG: T9SS type A sorting domain-containing protein [Paludibacteraceae bacterium]|nr:T9SS type A sorting domain-containing protein [Paludibacteraceae bacterium]